MSIEERICGCLLAGALGDAIGNAYEGTAPTTDVKLPRTLRVSDDTQLTLATCEATTARGGAVDPEAVSQSLLGWFRAGRVTGIGSSTLKALRDLDAGVHWALAGSSGERAAGNGAAMRIAPIALAVDPETRNGRRLVWDVARITHRNDEACCGALAITLAIRLACSRRWNGGPGLLEPICSLLPDSRVRDRLLALVQTDESVEEIASAHGATGYVVDSVGLALAAAERLSHRPLLEALRTVVSCGGDTDTNAALLGNILGCIRPPDETDRHREALDANHSAATIIGEFAEVVSPAW